MSFDGFVWPKENWFRLPNEWTDIMAGMSSMAEVKVVLYVMRHTWGFNEPDKMKYITTDEFMHGRKRKDGSRMDRGTGLSNKAVYDGLKKAVEERLLEMETDTADRGRIKNYYRLRMQNTPVNLTGANVENTKTSVESTGAGVENTDRTEKDTFGKTPLEKHSLSEQSPDGENGDPKASRKKQPSRFDHKCVKELRKAVSTVIKVNSRASLNEWAHQFRLLRQRDGVSQTDIRRAIEWYAMHIGQEYIPEAHSAKAFRSKYVNGQIPSAMKRCSKQPVPDDPYNRTPKEAELDKVRSKLLNGQYEKEGRTWKPTQEELDGVLAGMGIEAGKYFPGEI